MGWWRGGAGGPKTEFQPREAGVGRASPVQEEREWSLEGVRSGAFGRRWRVEQGCSRAPSASAHSPANNPPLPPQRVLRQHGAWRRG